MVQEFATRHLRKGYAVACGVPERERSLKQKTHQECLVVKPAELPLTLMTLLKELKVCTCMRTPSSQVGPPQVDLWIWFAVLCDTRQERNSEDIPFPGAGPQFMVRLGSQPSGEFKCEGFWVCK